MENLNARPSALVVEDAAVASTNLARMGLIPEVYHPRQVNTSATQHVLRDLRGGKFGVVWMELPSSGRTVPPKKRSSTISEMALWMRAAQQGASRAVLIGPRGRCWQSEALEDLVQTKALHESQHTMCHFGVVHSDAGVANSTTFNARTTLTVAWSKCQCPAGTQHCYEHSSSRDGRVKACARRKAIMMM